MQNVWRLEDFGRVAAIVAVKVARKAARPVIIGVHQCLQSERCDTKSTAVIEIWAQAVKWAQFYMILFKICIFAHSLGSFSWLAPVSCQGLFIHLGFYN